MVVWIGTNIMQYDTERAWTNRMGKNNERKHTKHKEHKRKNDMVLKSCSVWTWMIFDSMKGGIYGFNWVEKDLSGPPSSNGISKCSLLQIDNLCESLSLYIYIFATQHYCYWCSNKQVLNVKIHDFQSITTWGTLDHPTGWVSPTQVSERWVLVVLVVVEPASSKV